MSDETENKLWKNKWKKYGGKRCRASKEDKKGAVHLALWALRYRFKDGWKARHFKGGGTFDWSKELREQLAALRILTAMDCGLDFRG